MNARNLYLTLYPYHTGSQPKEQIRQTLNTPVQAEEEKIESLAPPIKKVVIDINQPQVCSNKGCGKTFKERDNHETACSYHPGPPVFHDRLKGVRNAFLCSVSFYQPFSLSLLSLCWIISMLSLCSGNAAMFTWMSLTSSWKYRLALKVGIAAAPVRPSDIYFFPEIFNTKVYHPF